MVGGMSLLPERHPTGDFFIAEVTDAMPKDDTASMAHPFFSLATKPDQRHLQYGSGENRIDIIPSTAGLPTIMDKDILIFCISQAMHRKNKGQPISKRVRFSARELSIATNRPIGGNHYKRLERAFVRLRGATFKSNIRTGGRVETRIYGLIDEGGFVMKDDGSFRLDYCEVVLSDWIMRAIESNEVVSISRDYFRLRRPLERRLYEIARKHCGNSPKWHIGLEKLQDKTGSNAPIKKFRHSLREIIKADVTPFYQFELNPESDLVTIRPRTAPTDRVGDIVIPAWAEEKARAAAIERGWDFHALRSEWIEFAKAQTAKGNPPKNAGAAFVRFCEKKEKLR